MDLYNIIMSYASFVIKWHFMTNGAYDKKKYLIVKCNFPHHMKVIRQIIVPIHDTNIWSISDMAEGNVGRFYCQECFLDNMLAKQWSTINFKASISIGPNKAGCQLLLSLVSIRSCSFEIVFENLSRAVYYIREKSCMAV